MKLRPLNFLIFSVSLVVIGVNLVDVFFNKGSANKFYETSSLIIKTPSDTLKLNK